MSEEAKIPSTSPVPEWVAQDLPPELMPVWNNEKYREHISPIETLTIASRLASGILANAQNLNFALSMAPSTLQYCVEIVEAAAKGMGIKINE